jgi:hypothetical protein
LGKRLLTQRTQRSERNTGDLFLIEEGIAHAKVAKVGKVYRGFIFIGEEIAHAKDAKVGKGRLGVQRLFTFFFV